MLKSNAILISKTSTYLSILSLNKQNFVINILSYCAAANGETVLSLLFPASVALNDKIKLKKKKSDSTLCRTKTSRKPLDGRDINLI